MLDNLTAAACAAFDVFPEIAAQGDWDRYTLAAVEIENFNVSESPLKGDWISDFEAEFAAAEAAIDLAILEFQI